jgi:hypothetical protein
MAKSSKRKGNVLVGLVGDRSGTFDPTKPNDNKGLGPKVGLVGRKQEASRARARMLARQLVDQIFDALESDTPAVESPLRTDGVYSDIEKVRARRLMRMKGLR